jgi:hypothetical protein
VTTKRATSASAIAKQMTIIYEQIAKQSASIREITDHLAVVARIHAETNVLIEQQANAASPSKGSAHPSNHLLHEEIDQ